MANLPYQAGFALIGLIILLFIVKAVYQVQEIKEIRLNNHEREAEDCLLKYQHKHCSIDNLDGECKKLFECMRKKVEEQGILSYGLQIVEHTFSIITKDILGPIMIGILGFLLKMIQVLTSRHRKND